MAKSLRFKKLHAVCSSSALPHVCFLFIKSLIIHWALLKTQSLSLKAVSYENYKLWTKPMPLKAGGTFGTGEIFQPRFLGVGTPRLVYQFGLAGGGSFTRPKGLQLLSQGGNSQKKKKQRYVKSPNKRWGKCGDEKLDIWIPHWTKNSS